MTDQPDQITAYYRRPLDDRQVLRTVLCALVEIKRRLMNLEMFLQDIEKRQHNAQQFPE